MHQMETGVESNSLPSPPPTPPLSSGSFKCSCPAQHQDSGWQENGRATEVFRAFLQPGELVANLLVLAPVTPPLGSPL